MLANFRKEYSDLLFTDTDSVTCHFKKKDTFEFIRNNKDLFDLLNYDENHELYDTSNNDVIGKLKKERPNNQIIEFIWLHSKLYRYITEKKIVNLF